MYPEQPKLTSRAIDDVLISVFRAPHLFTAEDTVEISCHGFLYIQQKIMQLLINNGCRAVQPGEFTMRAFVNGKIDLSQAEAVADLIAFYKQGYAQDGNRPDEGRIFGRVAKT